MAQHIVTPRTYLLVFAALIVLTGITVAIGFVHLGTWHPVVGLTIGAAKATLVILFFMHVYYSPRLIWLVALGSLLWLGILISYTMTDYVTRNQLPVIGN